MIRIGILGDIGSGKSYIADNFGYPVFNADYEVAQLYQKDKNIFNKLKIQLPKYIHSFPIDKKEVSNAILSNKKIVILDIPLLLENKINKKEDILVYVQSKKSFILKNLKKRKNFNQKLLKKFKAIQLPISIKKKKSHFIVKNNFTKKSVNDGIKDILKKLNKWRK